MVSGGRSLDAKYQLCTRATINDYLLSLLWEIILSMKCQSRAWYFERAYLAWTEVLFLFLFSQLRSNFPQVSRGFHRICLISCYQPDYALGMSYVNRISKLLIIKSYLINPSSLSVCSSSHSQTLKEEAETWCLVQGCFSRSDADVC